MQTIPLIIVASYLIGMLIVGFVVGKLKIKNSQDYMVAGRRMGLFMVAFSLSANNIGGGSTTGLAEGVRHVGHERRLVRPDRIHRHDPVGILCTQDPQNHGCHDP